ncbi:MAG: polysaccharide biosynthesis tyrosine autokinase [Rhodospirillales bacterium]|nr:polysaccharide biosynthesis tyrosine autokinase [Rhodospirillales bacterium]
MSLSQPEREPIELAADLRAPETVSPLRLLEVLWRRRWTFLLVAALAMAAAGWVILRLRPSYEARALVLVDTRKNVLSDVQAIAAGAQADTIEVRTQVDILRSPALAEQVARRLDLPAMAEFGGGPPAPPPPWHGLALRLRALVGAPAPPPAPPDATARLREVTAMLTGGRVSVVNDGRSYIIGIQARAHAAELSAAIANAYAQVYLDFNRALKDRAVARANAWLDGRLAPLQAKLRIAERNVADFEAAHGLIEDRAGAAGTTRPATVLGQQLAQINTQLVLATAEQAQREAAADQIRAALAGQADLYSVPQVLGSALIQRLRGQEAEASARAANLAITQQEGSVALRGVRAELGDLHGRILDEARKIGASIESEAQTAGLRVTALQESLTRLQAKVAEQGKAEIQLRQLQSEADAARAVYMDYLNRAERSANERDIQQPDAELISLAGVPLAPAPPTTRQYLALAALAAALLGMVAALLRERMEPGFRSAEQVEAQTGLPVLGFLPQVRKRARARALDGADFGYGEAMTHVRGMLQRASLAGHPRVVLVTSALPREGKTFFAVSLARAMARAGGRSLLVDCDLRRPSVIAAAGLPAAPGRGPREVAVTGGSALDPLLRRDTISTLDILDASAAVPEAADAAAFVASGQLAALLGEARGRYDLVVIDAPPVLAFVDARVLSQLADTTLLLVRWRRTPRTLASSALKALRSYDARIAGVVMTQVNMRALGAGEGAHGYVARKYSAYFK